MGLWGDVHNREENLQEPSRGKSKCQGEEPGFSSSCRTAGSARTALSEPDKTEGLGASASRDDRKRVKNEELLLRP